MFFSLLFALAAHAAPSWIEASNAIARQYATADGKLFPERASALGLHEFDAQALHMQRDQDDRELRLLSEWREKLAREASQARDHNLRIDLRILREHLEQRAEEIRLERKYRKISFFPGARFVLESLLALVNEQSTPERKAAAVERFRKYVRGEGAEPPLLTAFRNRTLAEKILSRKKALPPLRLELEEYLAESPAYVKGVEGLLAGSGAQDWQEDLAAFREQSAAYDEFVKQDLLPIAREDFRLPKELAAARKRSFSQRCFSDGVLALGILPVEMIGSELGRNLRCAPIVKREDLAPKPALRSEALEGAPALKSN